LYNIRLLVLCVIINKQLELTNIIKLNIACRQMAIKKRIDFSVKME